MRKQDYRRALGWRCIGAEGTPQVRDYLRFGIDVNRGERVVQHEESGSSGDRASETEALTLAAGDAHAELADWCLLSLWKRLYIDSHRSELQQALHIARPRLRAEKHVVRDGAGEEESLLWRIANQPWTCLDGRGSVQQDLSAIDGIQPGQA